MSNEVEIIPPLDSPKPERRAEPPVFIRGHDRSEARKEEDAADAGVIAGDDDEILDGRRKHYKTKKSSLEVSLMTFFGYSQVEVAQHIGYKDPKTLRKHYREELELARTIVDVEVFKAWFSNIQAGKEMTILRYLEHKFDRLRPPPPKTGEEEMRPLTEQKLRELAHKINQEF